MSEIFYSIDVYYKSSYSRIILKFSGTFRHNRYLGSVMKSLEDEVLPTIVEQIKEKGYSPLDMEIVYTNLQEI